MANLHSAAPIGEITMPKRSKKRSTTDSILSGSIRSLLESLMTDSSMTTADVALVSAVLHPPNHSSASSWSERIATTTELSTNMDRTLFVPPHRVDLLLGHIPSAGLRHIAKLLHQIGNAKFR